MCMMSISDCYHFYNFVVNLIIHLSVNKSLYNINCCVEAGSPLETLRSLQKPPGTLPFPYLEAEDYQLALEQEKREGFPQKTIVITNKCIIIINNKFFIV